jgi:hypothetical protein
MNKQINENYLWPQWPDEISKQKETRICNNSKNLGTMKLLEAHELLVNWGASTNDQMAYLYCGKGSGQDISIIRWQVIVETSYRFQHTTLWNILIVKVQRKTRGLRRQIRDTRSLSRKRYSKKSKDITFKE